MRKQLRFSLLHRVSCGELSVYVCPRSFLCTRWQVTRRWEVLISTSRIHHLVTDKSERADQFKSNSKQSLGQSCNKVVDVTGQVCRRPASFQNIYFVSFSVCPFKQKSALEASQPDTTQSPVSVDTSDCHSVLFFS